MTQQKHPHLIHPKYRPDIDGLRAIAILAVVVYHAFPGLLPGGFMGVDIFFVISGFLISTIIFSSLEHERFSLVEFYARRIRRIAPALLLVLAACLVFGWVVLLPSEYKQLGKHTLASIAFIQNFVLWQETGYFNNAAETKPLLHLWSLAIEEQFYLVWPLLLALVWQRQFNFLKATAVIAALSFAANIYLARHNPIAAFYLPFSRFWELMAGGMLAYSALHRPQFLAQQKNLQSVLGFLCVLLGLWLLNKTREFPGWWALLPVLGTFLLISAGPSARLNEKLLSSKPMLWLGLVSYPLYLWHWPLLSFLKIIKGTTTSVERLAAIAAALLLAWLTYRLVEKPFRYGKPGRKVLTLLVLSGLIAAAAGLVYKAQGVQSRNAQWVDVAVRGYDVEANYRTGRCFLVGRTHDESFSAECDEGLDKALPTVVLWGDSHAAAEYRGLLSKSGNNFNLVQLNVSGCPPVMNFHVTNRKGCARLNSEILARLGKLKPDTVILAAYWMLYDGKNVDESGNAWELPPTEKINDTLSELKKLGVPNLYLVGQLPVFGESQINLGLREFAPGKSNRTYKSFNSNSAKVDALMGEIARNNQVRFISPINTLCNEQGCLISTSPQQFTPLAWDYGHLTTEGSEYFIDQAMRRGELKLPSGQP
jgi:peptidoglycan/LPS O-acetylase OafA/YrhL